ncbi:5-methylcytosine restriction system specificity protein McrC [Ensifer canadensis]
MKIPIRNLYYIFCYAWSRFPAGNQLDVGIDDCPDIPNLMAKLLLENTHRLTRRGLDRGYVNQIEELRAPRGRMLFDRMIKEQTLRRGAAICSFDELRHDVLHNQIIKATVRSLIEVESLSKPLHEELGVLLLQFSRVSDIRLIGPLFRRVQLSRDRQTYALLIRLCEFVFYSLMPDEKGEGTLFAEILDDEVGMSAIFEEFLRNFYAHEQTEFKVKRDNMPWNTVALTEGADAILPGMETDISLSSSERTIVIDAKYYKETLTGRPGSPKKVRSAHLYQLFTYLHHASYRYPGTQVDGALIYPAVGTSIAADYQIAGHRMRVVAIDLDRDWREIHQDLLGVPKRPFIATGVLPPHCS